MTARRLVFFASGRGSCFAAVQRAILDGTIPGAQTVGLICDRPEAAVVALSRTLKVECQVIDAADYGVGKDYRRADHEAAIRRAVDLWTPDWICLAGYMRVLSPRFVAHYEGKILNIHPSLLPAFKGVRAQRQAIEAGVRITGCTVHLVRAELDDGPILAQASIEVRDSDDEESLSARLLPLEHETYIRAVKDVCSRNFEIEGRRWHWTS